MLPALEKGSLLAAKMDDPSDQQEKLHLSSVKNEPHYQQFATNGQYTGSHLNGISGLHHPSRFTNPYAGQQQQQQLQPAPMSESFYMNSSLSGYKLPASPSSTSSSSSSSCSSYSMPSSAANFNYSLPFYSSVNGYSNQALNAPPLFPSNLLNHSKSQSFDSTSSSEEGILAIYSESSC